MFGSESSRLEVMNSTKMRLFLIATVLAVLSLAGCGSIESAAQDARQLAGKLVVKATRIAIKLGFMSAS